MLVLPRIQRKLTHLTHLNLANLSAPSSCKASELRALPFVGHAGSKVSHGDVSRSRANFRDSSERMDACHSCIFCGHREGIKQLWQLFTESWQRLKRARTRCLRQQT
mmetsp:Transcript_5895/g.11675  ORF Transcript_5895/g.11675 Transcript_5895/m.11675 type:complete len:107 (+) Transcript_5895:71-391(+)